MNPFKWGIIGPGNIARDFTNDLAHCETPQTVVSILGHRQETTVEFKQEFNIPHSYLDIRDFLNGPAMDAVYIATPHTLHYDAALMCLEKNIPVLCEKPITINAAQLDTLMKASTTNSTFLMEGMWTRFLPSTQLLLQIIEQDTIGNIVAVKASMSYKAPYDPKSRYFNPDLGGGSLLDLGIYPVFLSMLLLGRPSTIHAVGKLSNKGIDETCSMLFEYANHQYAMLDSSIVTQMDLLAEVIGEKGVIKILPPWTEKPAAIEVTPYNGTKMAYPCEWEGHGFQFEADEVVRCIRQKQTYSNMLSQHFSLDMLEIMDQIRDQIHVRYNKYE